MSLALPRGRGRAAAPLVWLFLASCLNLRSKGTDVWPSNATIARRTGLSPRSVEYALVLLAKAGKISTQHRVWRGKKYRYGRTIILLLECGREKPRVLFPPVEHVMHCWRQARRVRERPASVVALAVAAWVWAAAGRGKPPRKSCTVNAPLKHLRALTGAAHGETFANRLADLSLAGLLNPAGKSWRDGIYLTVDGSNEQDRAITNFGDPDFSWVGDVPEDYGVGWDQDVGPPCALFAL